MRSKPVARIGKATKAEVKAYLEKIHAGDKVVAQTQDHLVIVRYESGRATEAQIFEIDHKFIAIIDGYIGRKIVGLYCFDTDSANFLKVVSASFAEFK